MPGEEEVVEAEHFEGYTEGKGPGRTWPGAEAGSGRLAGRGMVNLGVELWESA